MTVAEVGLLSCEEEQAPVRVGWTPVSGRRLRPSSLRGALAAVVTGGHVDVRVRTEIVDSWRRTDDRAVLWACASHGVDFGTPARGRGPFEVRLTSGRSVLVTCEPVHDGSGLVGALLRIDPRPELADGPPPASRRRVRRRGSGGPVSRRPSWSSPSGWQAATPNVAIAAQLNMSPHTVDSHIRHIYGKLGITSRIELARLMMSDQQRSSGTLGASPRSTP